MVDRLEELLEMMNDEDEDGQEDALALGIERAAPVPAPGAGAEDEKETEDWTDAPERAEAGAAGSPAQGGGLGAAALPFGGERQAEAGLAKAGRGRTLSAALSALGDGGGRTSEPPGPVRPRTAIPAAEGGAVPAESAEAGLEELYRRTAQAVRPAARGVPAGQTERTGPEEPGGTAALTVDELDRAVKRDSRRYDGGMSIF